MNYELPEHLLSILETTTINMPAILLLRHAEREPIVSGDDGVNADLTPQGYKQAYTLGERLGKQLMWAQYSPLLRAKHTVEQVAKGAGTTSLITSDNSLLGCPGPFVVDRKKGGELFTKLGTETLVRELASGTQFDGVRSAKKGAEFFIQHLKTIFQNLSGLGLMISHDAIIIPLLAAWTKECFQDSWLNPLDGALLVAKPKNGILIYRNNKFFEIT